MFLSPQPSGLALVDLAVHYLCFRSVVPVLVLAPNLLEPPSRTIQDVLDILDTRLEVTNLHTRVVSCLSLNMSRFLVFLRCCLGTPCSMAERLASHVQHRNMFCVSVNHRGTGSQCPLMGQNLRDNSCPPDKGITYWIMCRCVS